MKFTVVTVCLNAAATIERTVQSVLAQDFPDIEYLAIDGMSTDATPEILDRHRDRIARVIREPDRGIFDAMNKGIAASTGDVLHFLNADDRFADAHVLSRVAATLAANPAVAVAFGDCIVDTGRDTFTIRHPDRLTRFRLYVQNLCCQQTIFYRREAFERVGRFDPTYAVAGDGEWNLRAFLTCRLPHLHLDFPVCIFSQTGRSETAVRQRFVERIRMKRQYYTLGERVVFGLAKGAREVAVQASTGRWRLPEAVRALRPRSPR